MESWFNQEIISNWFFTILAWTKDYLVSWENLVQVGILLVIRLVGVLAGRPATRFIEKKSIDFHYPHILLASFIRTLFNLISLILSVVILLIGLQVFRHFGLTSFILELVLNLSVAWIVIQLATSVILDPYWSRFAAIIIWFLTALNIIGVFESIVTLLGNTGFSIGQTRLTLLSLLQATIILTILLRIINWLNSQFERRLNVIPGLNPSTRLMMGKVTHITMLVLVTLIVLNTIGIDFSSLALFSGAIGVGVGFGLQKVVANYVSGLILLSDKSIKPGDVIQLADAFGWVRQMGGRYISVVTRDEKEYLVPNEDFITNQVINWSYSNDIIRLKVGFGVSYKSDPHQVINLVNVAIENIDRILRDPSPTCLLKKFGDSSIDFELRFWIKDPQNGISNISSKVLLKIWDTFKSNQIEIPYPQRDVYLKN
jgi:small-conductance mechanosensitive channel